MPHSRRKKALLLAPDQGVTADKEPSLTAGLLHLVVTAVTAGDKTAVTLQPVWGKACSFW